MGFTAFDPATKSATVTLSSGNLVATSGTTAADTGAMGIAADAESSGKTYYEMTVGAGFFGDYGFGIGTTSSTYVNLGNNATIGAVVFASGSLYINGSNTGGIGTTGFHLGDVIGIAVDFTNHLVWMKNITQGTNWNNSGTADPATGVGGRTIASGSYVPVIIFAASTPGQVGTANFGGSTFTGSVPAGFASGWSGTGGGGGGGSTSRQPVIIITQ